MRFFTRWGKAVFLFLLTPPLLRLLFLLLLLPILHRLLLLLLLILLLLFLHLRLLLLLFILFLDTFRGDNVKGAVFCFIVMSLFYFCFYRNSFLCNTIPRYIKKDIFSLSHTGLGRFVKHCLHSLIDRNFFFVWSYPPTLYIRGKQRL